MDASRNTLVIRYITVGKTVTDDLAEQRPGARARVETAADISLDVSSEKPVSHNTKHLIRIFFFVIMLML